MIRHSLFTAVLVGLVAFASVAPTSANAYVGTGDTTTICMPFSPGWMQCTEYGENFEVIRQYMIRDNSGVGYIL
jgi:hypothetical protein